LVWLFRISPTDTSATWVTTPAALEAFAVSRRDRTSLVAEDDGSVLVVGETVAEEASLGR
jgi:hypothetical protein